MGGDSFKGTGDGVPPEFIIFLHVVQAPVAAGAEREFFIDNLLVRIYFIIVMMRWTGLAPWEFEVPFPGSLTSTFLEFIIFLHMVQAPVAAGADFTRLYVQGYLAHKKTSNP